MNTLSETQKFVYATMAIITLIASVGKKPTMRESKAALGLILSTDELLRNYHYALHVRRELEQKLQENFYRASQEIFNEIYNLKVRPDFASFALEIGVKYLKRNVRITADKISVIEEASHQMGIPFKRHLSYWIK